MYLRWWVGVEKDRLPIIIRHRKVVPANKPLLATLPEAPALVIVSKNAMFTSEMKSALIFVSLANMMTR
jgi:hypothetical protein